MFGLVGCDGDRVAMVRGFVDGMQLDVDLVYGFGVGGLVLNPNLGFCCSTSNWWCVEVLRIPSGDSSTDLGWRFGRYGSGRLV